MHRIGQNIAECGNFETMFSTLKNLCEQDGERFEICLGDEASEQKPSGEAVELAGQQQISAASDGCSSNYHQRQLKMCQVQLIQEGEELDSFLS